jgi:hypothetical protein
MAHLQRVRHPPYAWGAAWSSVSSAALLRHNRPVMGLNGLRGPSASCGGSTEL